MSIRRLVAICLLAVTILGLAACAAPSTANGAAPAANASAKTIRIGVDSTYPPMEFKNDQGQVVGFDVDFAKALSKKLGWNVEFVDSAWEGIIPGLQSQRFDAIISAMNVTEERSQQVDFIPYMNLGQIIVVRPDNNTIKSTADLAGKVIGAQLGTTCEEAAKKIPGVKEVKTYNGADAFQDLAAGRLDAIVVDNVVGQYRQTQAPGAFKTVGDVFEKAPIGIAVRKGDSDLKNALTKALADIKADGTFGTVSKTWFGTIVE